MVKPATETPAIRETMADAVHELRAYVLSVSSHVKRKDPATAALAERLLKPLTDWRERPVRGATPMAGEPADPTATGPAVKPDTAAPDGK